MDNNVSGSLLLLKFHNFSLIADYSDGFVIYAIRAMADIAAKRLKKELKDMRTQDDFKSNKFRIQLVDGSLYHMLASIAGPPDTPYSQGIFNIDINIPPKYPFSPPKARFITRMWHPNVSSVTGCICLDILDSNWAAALTIRGVLLSLECLLQDAAADNPLDAVVARQYLTNRPLFDQTASYWTAVYASSDPKLRKSFTEFEKKLSELRETVAPEIPEDKLISALSSHDWDVSRSVNSLIIK